MYRLSKFVSRCIDYRRLFQNVSSLPIDLSICFAQRKNNNSHAEYSILFERCMQKHFWKNVLCHYWNLISLHIWFVSSTPQYHIRLLKIIIWFNIMSLILATLQKLSCMIYTEKESIKHFQFLWLNIFV